MPQEAEMQGGYQGRIFARVACIRANSPWELCFQVRTATANKRRDVRQSSAG